MMTLMAILTYWRHPAGAAHPTFGRSALVGLLLGATCLAISATRRALIGRNDGMAIYLIAMMPICMNPDHSRHFSETLRRLAPVLLFLYLGNVLLTLLQRMVERRRSKPRPSPMADAEVDARPVA